MKDLAAGKNTYIFAFYTSCSGLNKFVTSKSFLDLENNPSWSLIFSISIQILKLSQIGTLVMFYSNRGQLNNTNIIIIAERLLAVHTIQTSVEAPDGIHIECHLGVYTEEPPRGCGYESHQGNLPQLLLPLPQYCPIDKCPQSVRELLHNDVVNSPLLTVLQSKSGLWIGKNRLVRPASTMAFSLVPHKPLMIQEWNLVSLYKTVMSSSRSAQNFMTLTSCFSELALILTWASLWMALSVVLPSSYLMLSWLIDLEDFY